MFKRMYRNSYPICHNIFNYINSNELSWPCILLRNLNGRENKTANHPAQVNKAVTTVKTIRIAIRSWTNKKNVHTDARARDIVVTAGEVWHTTVEPRVGYLELMGSIAGHFLVTRWSPRAYCQSSTTPFGDSQLIFKRGEISQLF